MTCANSLITLKENNACTTTQLTSIFIEGTNVYYNNTIKQGKVFTICFNCYGTESEREIIYYPM